MGEEHPLPGPTRGPVNPHPEAPEGAAKPRAHVFPHLRGVQEGLLSPFRHLLEGGEAQEGQVFEALAELGLLHQYRGQLGPG